ncbi:hypothetical protein [Mycetocola tolaasinivorans]|uniref:hypothetical protein n=1 Tax=Mycetocola tolaasinivorans TaxID=76635 RepID=UPI0011C3AEA8|nr:hypothetical protein [Mycetocola tolaasinivorans]
MKRKPPRPARFRQETYLDEFDFTTVAYDVFQAEGNLELVGPPLLNMRRRFLTQVKSKGSKYIDRRKAYSLRIPDSDEIRDRLVNGEPDLAGPFESSLTEMFRGRNVIATMQKNNDLEWIKYWAKYYVNAHEVTGIVIYNNNTTAYSAAELAEAASVPGLELLVVVEWPFKRGPGGGPHAKWDSDFQQFASFEHARRKYFRHARSVINADIDELVIVSSGLSMGDHLERSGKAAAVYGGRWMSAVESDGSAENPYRKYLFVESGSKPCATKWSYRPSALPEDAVLEVHSIRDIELDEDISYRHFRGINTGWKYDRTRPPAGDVTLAHDDVLDAALERAQL